MALEPNQSYHGGDEPYYAKDGKVWKRSIMTPYDGGVTHTLCFPVCEMTDLVGAEAAETVAALMNAGDAVLDADDTPARASEAG